MKCTRCQRETDVKIHYCGLCLPCLDLERRQLQCELSAAKQRIEQLATNLAYAQEIKTKIESTDTVARDTRDTLWLFAIIAIFLKSCF